MGRPNDIDDFNDDDEDFVDVKAKRQKRFKNKNLYGNKRRDEVRIKPQVGKIARPKIQWFGYEDDDELWEDTYDEYLDDYFSP